jgi:BirA family transcriptional regulator, biotin operon repressor / biotin---[acetyl-CoA-carboxylase] ligase
MSPELRELYVRLADGQRHNGAELADELGISRAAVWKRIESLRRIGLPLKARQATATASSMPSSCSIESLIRKHLAKLGHPVETVGAVDSTNARLAARAPVHRQALVAEAQKAGRGRRGRNWLSPPGGIYLSLGWHFESGLAGLAPLSLVVGLAAARTLTRPASRRSRSSGPTTWSSRTPSSAAAWSMSTAPPRDPARPSSASASTSTWPGQSKWINPGPACPDMPTRFRATSSLPP